MSKYSEAIQRLLPGAEFNLTHHSDGRYDIIWLDVRSQPSNEDIDAEVLLVEAELPWRSARLQRGMLLRSSDWTAVTDTALSEVEQSAWETYRQELRDLPQTYDNAADIVWPETPEV